MFGPLKTNPRLGQWNGRRRSSRSDEPMLPKLWRRPVLLRLAVVLLTTFAVTALAYGWGSPLPYRIGETSPHDLRVRIDFEVVNPVELINQKEGPLGAEPARRPAVEKYPQGTLLI